MRSARPYSSYSSKSRQSSSPAVHSLAIGKAPPPRRRFYKKSTSIKARQVLGERDNVYGNYITAVKIIHPTYHWPLCSSIPRERGHGPTHGGPNKSRIGQAQWNSWGVGGIPFPPDRSDQLLTSPRSDQLLIPPLAGRREHTRLSTCATPIIVSAATATRHFPLPWSTASSTQVHKRIRDVGGVTGVVSARGAVSLYHSMYVLDCARLPPSPHVVAGTVRRRRRLPLGRRG